METVVGLASSFAGLLALSGTIIKIGHSFYYPIKEFDQEVQSIHRDIAQIEYYLKTIQPFFTALEETLFPASLAAGISSEPILRSEDILACNATLEDIKKLYEKSIKVKGRPGRNLLKRCLWPLSRKEVYDIVKRLERNKSALHEALAAHGLKVQHHEFHATTSERAIVRLEREAKMHQVTLEWLSAHNFQGRYYTLRKKRVENTGHWLLQKPEFVNWLEQECFPILCCQVGSGKSTLASIVIDHIEKTLGEDCVVTFAYLDYKDKDTHSAINVAANLLKQLVARFDNIPRELHEIFERSRKDRRHSKELEELREWMLKCTEYLPRVFLVLDGIDECEDEAARQKIIKFLDSLKGNGIKIFVTTRLSLPRPMASIPIINIRAQDSDIKMFVQAKLREYEPDPDEEIPLDLKDEIVEKIIFKADGMFLLAELQLHHVLLQSTVRKMRKALLTLPLGIDDAFDDAWERIEKKDHERRDNLGVATAFWVLTATRPLSVSELCEALSIDPNSSDHDPEDRPTISKVIKSSSGLVVVEHSSGTVRFAHSAVHDWFLKKKRPRNYLVAAICLVYLTFDKFATGPILSTNNLVVDDVQHQEKFDQLLRKYPLLHYAACNWTFHVSQMSIELPTPLTRLVERLFTSRDHFEMMRQVRYTTKMNGLWLFDSYPTFSDPVHFIVREGLSFEIFPSTPEPGILCTLRDSYRRTVLHEACMVQRLDMVRLIVGMNLKDAVNAVDILNVSTLHFAAEAGNSEIIDVLVKAGADLFHLDVWGFMPFQRAVCSGHTDVAKALLANMLDVIESSGDFLSTTDPLGYTLLHQAAALGYKDGVERLLLMRAAATERTRSYSYRTTPLHRAAECGHADILITLLSHFDITKIPPDGYGALPLHRAAKLGHEDCVDILLKANPSDASVRDVLGFTALHWAAAGGFLSILKKLLPLTETVLSMEILTPYHLAYLGNNPVVREYLVNEDSPISETLVALQIPSTMDQIFSVRGTFSNPPVSPEFWVNTVAVLCWYFGAQQMTRGNHRAAICWFDLEFVWFDHHKLNHVMMGAVCDKCTNYTYANPRYKCLCVRCNKTIEGCYDLCAGCHNNDFILPKTRVHNRFIELPSSFPLPGLEEQLSKLKDALESKESLALVPKT